MKLYDVDKLTELAWIQSDLHGPKHWARVAHFGKKLATLHGLDERAHQCVELFAWTHDLARLSEGEDLEHSQRGAEFLPRVIGHLNLSLNDEVILLTRRAIEFHNAGFDAEQAYHQGLLEGFDWNKDDLLLTVGACWDADRLDLLRLGREPDPNRMSTPYWEEVLALARKIHGKPDDHYLDDA